MRVCSLRFPRVETDSQPARGASEAHHDEVAPELDFEKRVGGFACGVD